MSLPEPLQRFPDPDTSALIEVNQWLEKYTHAVSLNRILPNTFEAVRVELTYHSNAIEGSTLTLRDTQLVVEGREPNSGKSLREIYEARNHDRALRMIEGWAVERRTQPLTDADILAIHAEIWR